MGVLQFRNNSDTYILQCFFADLEYPEGRVGIGALSAVILNTVCVDQLCVSQEFFSFVVAVILNILENEFIYLFQRSYFISSNEKSIFTNFY